MSDEILFTEFFSFPKFRSNNTLSEIPHIDPNKVDNNTISFRNDDRNKIKAVFAKRID